MTSTIQPTKENKSMSRKSTTPRMSATSKRKYITLEDFTELVTILGLDGASHVLKMARDGMKVKDLTPIMTFYAERMAALSTRQRAAHQRKVEKLAAKARELKKEGKL
jgi:hypothetical protein